MSRPVNWQQEGREVGVTLDACHAVVVVGSDPVATADVALGIARVQAQHRRVAVADMFGEAPPLQALVTNDDPHGLVDSFLFGVSLSRIAHLVPDAGELFVIRAGTAPLDYDELFAHPRWRKLAAGFAEAGALLLVAAPTGAAQISTLVQATDGAVLVGDDVPPDLPVSRSLAWIRPRRAQADGPVLSLPPAQRVPTGVEALAAPGLWRRYAGPVTGLCIAALLAALALWFANRPFSGTSAAHRGVSPGSPAAATMTAGAPSSPAVRSFGDSVAAGGMNRSASPGLDSFPTLVVTDPADSASASSYAVLLEETLTKSGAILNLEQKFKSVPVATFGVNPRTRFFPVFTGAFSTRAGADSLLASLRARKVLGPAAGMVTTVPYAFLVQSDVAAASVAPAVARYRAGGHPVYALRQPNGTVHLYFGAYATPQEAALAIPAARDAKLTPTLVYRIGRVF